MVERASRPSFERHVKSIAQSLLHGEGVHWRAEAHSYRTLGPRCGRAKFHLGLNPGGGSARGPGRTGSTLLPDAGRRCYYPHVALSAKEMPERTEEAPCKIFRAWRRLLSLCPHRLALMYWAGLLRGQRLGQHKIVSGPGLLAGVGG